MLKVIIALGMLVVSSAVTGMLWCSTIRIDSDTIFSVVGGVAFYLTTYFPIFIVLIYVAAHNRSLSSKIKHSAFLLSAFASVFWPLPLLYSKGEFHEMGAVLLLVEFVVAILLSSILFAFSFLERRKGFSNPRGFEVIAPGSPRDASVDT